jgi:glycogen synthase
MHIALVTSTYPPDNGWGGIGTYVFHLAQGLQKLGYRVSVICGYLDVPKDSYESNIRVIRHLAFGQAAIANLRQQVLVELTRLIQEEDLDIVEFPEYEALGLEFQRVYPDFPCVVKLHSDSQLVMLGNAPSYQKLPRKFYYSYIYPRIHPNEAMVFDHHERETTARAHAVMSPSQWQMQQCIDRSWRLPHIAEIIANPFGSWNLQDISDLSEPESPTILLLGRLCLRKGTNLMPSIFQRVWAKAPTARFELIGQSLGTKERQSWPEWLISQVPEAFRSRVVLHGGIPYLDLPRYLNSQAIGLFASTWESFGYTHVECMSAGMPCVIASVGGAQELGQHGKHCLNTPRTPNDIADALLELIYKPNLRGEIGMAARQHVIEQYAPERIAKQTVELYTKVLPRVRVGI